MKARPLATANELKPKDVGTFQTVFKRPTFLNDSVDLPLPSEPRYWGQASAQAEAETMSERTIAENNRDMRWAFFSGLWRFRFSPVRPNVQQPVESSGYRPERRNVRIVANTGCLFRGLRRLPGSALYCRTGCQRQSDMHGEMPAKHRSERIAETSPTVRRRHGNNAVLGPRSPTRPANTSKRTVRPDVEFPCARIRFEATCGPGIPRSDAGRRPAGDKMFTQSDVETPAA